MTMCEGRFTDDSWSLALKTALSLRLAKEGLPRCLATCPSSASLVLQLIIQVYTHYDLAILPL